VKNFIAIILTTPFLVLMSSAHAGWAPCGGAEDKLWSWAWAGESGENVTTVGGTDKQRIIEMLDLSGNGHHYFNDSGSQQPAFQVGLSVHGFTTSLPIVAADRFADGTQVYMQWMDQVATMLADGGFYLAFAGMNTRDAGHRHLWGRAWDNLVRVDQGRNRTNIIINGTEHILAESESLPKGPILLEIWRDGNNVLHAWVNGQDISLPGVTSSEMFSMNGIGWSGDGTGGWDDYAFEYIACDDIPSSQQRDEVREYLRAKWRLYGEGALVSPPGPPADLRVD
jgi:hypothetical protein